MLEMTARKQFFAEEIAAIANLTTPALVEALGCVPREAFLQPGPWLLVGEGDFGGPARQTPDGDPKHIYHNLSVAIDATRRLFNGAPGIVSTCIDALKLKPGARVLHVGCGLGYYTAIMAHCVGGEGRVVAYEVDEGLATKARENLAAWSQVEVRHGNGSSVAEPRANGSARSATEDKPFDAIMSSAGLTHVPQAWLDALAVGGRMVLPLTFVFHPESPIGKGPVVVITKRDGEVHEASMRTMIAIYSAADLRDAAMNDALRSALGRNPFPQIRRLRCDAHEQEATCWMHTDGLCLSC